MSYNHLLFHTRREIIENVFFTTWNFHEAFISILFEKMADTYDMDLLNGIPNSDDGFEVHNGQVWVYEKLPPQYQKRFMLSILTELMEWMSTIKGGFKE